MPVVFSQHSKLQIIKRKIPLERVLQTVKKSDETLASFQSRKLRRRKFGGKILEVVTKTEGSRITVITAYYLEELL